MTAQSSAIVASLASIMGKVGSVEKRGKNTFHNYDYATAADIQHKLQPLLAEEGLVIFQNENATQLLSEGALMAITYEFTIAHKSGEVWPEKPRYTGLASAKNTKGGPDDKAANKCHTAARKYFLLSLFQIPTGDYDDADSEEDRPHGPNVSPPSAKEAAPQNGKPVGPTLLDSLIHDIGAFTDPAELKEWGTEMKPSIARLSTSDKARLTNFYKQRMALLAQMPPADKPLSEVLQDEIPV